MLDIQHQSVDISTYARTAHNSLLQKRLEEGLYWIIRHGSLTTQLVKGLNLTVLAKITGIYRNGLI